MISIILFITLIQSTKAVDELYTIYADGSVQYYTLKYCYHKFFPNKYNVTDPKTGMNITKTISSYLIVETKNPNIYEEWQFATSDCGGPVMYIENETAGINCKNCYYNITVNEIVSDTFSSLMFTPSYVKKCDDGKRFVVNNYPKSINGKCVDGILNGNQMSFITQIKKNNNNQYIERSRFLNYGCKGTPLETITLNCDACNHVKCEIDAYVQTSCQFVSSGNLLSIVLLMIILVVLM